MCKAKSRLKGNNAKRLSRILWTVIAVSVLFVACVVVYGNRGSELIVPHVVSASDFSGEVMPLPEPSKPAAYTPRKKTLALIAKHPELTAKIQSHFGSEWLYAAEIIARESSFDKTAKNKRSGACGLGQANPCEKMKCSLEDEDCQLQWVKNYVVKRYGNFKNAVMFHDKKGWY